MSNHPAPAATPGVPADEPAAVDQVAPTESTQPAGSIAPAVSAVAAEPAVSAFAAEPAVSPVADESAVSAVAGEPVGPVGFADLGLGPELLESLRHLGYATPTPVQAETIPHLLAGADVLGQAATGTGKTAAFSLPIVSRTEPGRPGAPRALVVVPTRELAVQVCDAIAGYGRTVGIQALAVYGGADIRDQIRRLRRGVHVVVGTPGRIIDLTKRRRLDLTDITTVVLDEADEILDMGFAEDIETILDATPPTRQTVLFSATMPARITSMADRHQRDPIRIEVGLGKDAPTNDLVRQTVYSVTRKHKAAALGRIIDIEAPESALVFCRTRKEVDELTVAMHARGYRAEALHGGMDQAHRDRVMARLRDGTAELLLATDVAARGLDVDTLTHVVNYDVPAQAESYVHRIGRVGRAGRQGVAITLAEPSTRGRLRRIERLVGRKLDVAPVPTVDMLRSRRLERTVADLRRQIGAGDLDEYQDVLHQLTDAAELRRIALAAIKLVHEHGNPLDETVIPETVDSGMSAHGRRGTGSSRRHDAGRSGNRRTRSRPGHDRGRGRPRSGRFNGDDTGFVFIGVGRRGHVRPGDVVGAIANETRLSGGDIGPIRIAEHYSVVGVPESSVGDVIRAINDSGLRGRRAKARRYVD